MSESKNPVDRSRLGRTAGRFAVALGLLVLFGWFFDVGALKSLGAGLSTMKANTALLFVVSGAALWLQSQGPSNARDRLLASVVIAVAGTTLLEYATGRSFGIDQFLVIDHFPVPPTAPPGRMGINSATCFLLGGIALVFTRQPRTLQLVSQVLALSSSAIATIALVAYAYSVQSSTGFASYTQMAVHTSLGLLVLGAGIMSVQPNAGIAGIINSAGPGGMLVRRVLPAILIGPFVLGWIQLQGQRAGLYETELGVAMFVVASSLVLAGILLAYAGRVDRIDARRRAAEEEVRQHDERMRFALAAARTGVWELDLVTRQLRWSDTMASIFGLSATEAPHTEDDFYRLVHPDDRDALKATLNRAVAGDADYAVEFRTTWSDGSTHWIYIRAEVSRADDHKAVMLRGVGLDVTERRSLEEQLRQSQKLEAIGHLAGGVAHDFNNVLTAIIGYSDLLLSDMDSNDQNRADIEEIRKAGDRAAALTQQLLAFSRGQMLQSRVLSLNELVEHMLPMLKRLVPAHIRITTHLPPDVGSVKGDATKIEQVLLNLAVNARDAMPQGGTLTFETANAALDANFQRQHAPVIAGDYVMLAVTDTGIGIDAETQRRIFEPFFTTKGVGAGTGLGLATVYGIVTQSGGYIWVNSEPGHGSTFKVYLPRVYEPLSSAVPAAEAEAQRSESETILVVDDDAEIRSLTRRILEQRGHRVLEAGDPAEALDVARSYEHQIALLLSDVIMPGSGRVSLFEELARERSGIRVLYMSGYADETIVKQGVLIQGAPFLQKPFTVQRLVEKVREVLDSPAA